MKRRIKGMPRIYRLIHVEDSGLISGVMWGIGIAAVLLHFILEA